MRRNGSDKYYNTAFDSDHIGELYDTIQQFNVRQKREETVFETQFRKGRNPLGELVRVSN